MVHVRASAIRARLDWVRTQRGPEHVEPIFAALDRHELAIRAAVTPNLWVPFDAYIALNIELDRRFGTGDLALCRVLGRYTAEVNLPTIYRIFYKIGTPTYILTKVAAVWTSHYDSGSASMRIIPGGCVVSVENFGTPHRCHCNAVLGWMEQTVIITGARLNDARESACRLRGAKACEFEILYDA
ncbi:hypothetical protein LZC95_36705 [Pendulispora brunnea]|uniref:4-vinyl reductase 4VR domain-containing protein n=1 Tax=Pendulispora brunnea TaxID=2905690 RepID=A0ABZ2JZQ8_9BACT